MAYPDLFFYLFAAMTVLFGALVVANPFSRSPVTSAMFLVLTILSLAGLYVLLHAFFIAAIQIIVYAGAVMVLFLFVIMLLDLRDEEKRRVKIFGLVTGLLATGALGVLLVPTLWQSGVGNGLNPTFEGDTKTLGRALFSEHLLPFEIVSLLLLAAMVGAILLSKKELK
ncbi:MAG: NADH-quinone oxidoreductase subunit J [Verrucomicrobia bacterium]|nr:NADH-quinone oxidoreductase subunit J [Verrucomicrobiota bacterium]